ncbi:hypothetical protein BASA62_002980 [Batrachochytrium salamandrivorans]|nr:hypothetical protein BASA62_002980 [Batrachochytrium salamandrivorans]
MPINDRVLFEWKACDTSVFSRLTAMTKDQGIIICGKGGDCAPSNRLVNILPHDAFTNLSLQNHHLPSFTANTYRTDRPAVPLLSEVMHSKSIVGNTDQHKEEDQHSKEQHLQISDHKPHMEHLQNQTFQNWAKTFSCEPELVLMAKTEDDVVQAIALARQRSLKLRVVGSGHSPSDISCTNGIMLNIDALNAVTKIDVETRQITIGAGIKLHQLNELLDRLGWALPNLGSISEQSIAGAISTGTHGTGIDFGVLAAMVLELELITASGEKHTASRTVAPDLFLAALCSLGCLGVITQHLRSADHVRFWWFPHTENCIVWKGARTTEPPQPIKPNWMKDTLLGVHFYEMSLFISTLVPAIVPTINKRFFDIFFGSPVSTIDKSFNVFNFDCLFSQYVTEWAIECSKAPEALTRLKKFLEEHPEVVAHSPVEIRFVKRDDIYLSMANGHDTCFIGIIMYRPYGKDVDKETYWKGYESIMMDLGGRPHWAKEHHLTAKDLRARYPMFDAFCAIRERMDPTNMFSNSYVERHIMDTAPMKAKL